KKISPPSLYIRIENARHRAPELSRTVRFPAPHENEADLIYAAFRNDEVAIARRLHVAHDAATARDRPALEFFGFHVETNQHVGPDRRFDIPDGAIEICNPVGL